MFEIAEDQGHVTVSCPPALSVGGIGESWRKLRSVIDAAPASVTVRAGEVGRLDTSVLQALLVLKRELDESGIPLHWGQCSDEFVRAVKLLGLSEALGMVQ